jgi:hypothetical protein
MCRVVFVGTLMIVNAALASEDRTAAPAPQERIVQWAPLHGGGNLIGEVRLLRRGDQRIVETILVTGLLRRVVGEIRDKEVANWPPDHSGHADALTYIDALEEARSELARQARRLPDEKDPERDHRLKLSIEFSSSPSAASVTLWDVDVERDGNAFRVTDRRELRRVAVGRDYIDRNMRLIIADSFDISVEEAAALLGSM